MIIISFVAFIIIAIILYIYWRMDNMKKVDRLVKIVIAIDVLLFMILVLSFLIKEGFI
jgi:hypothetical protein